MVSVLASSANDRGIEPWLDPTEDYEIGIYCFSAKHAAFKEKEQTGWLGIGIMCPKWGDMSTHGLVSVSYLYKNPTKRVGLVQSRPHHSLIEN